MTGRASGWRRASLIVTVVVTAITAGCTAQQREPAPPPAPASAPTPTTTASPDTALTTLGLHIGVPPAIPDQLPGWTISGQWTETISFRPIDTIPVPALGWTMPSGPDPGPRNYFPAVTTSCADRFLIRWKSSQGTAVHSRSTRVRIAAGDGVITWRPSKTVTGKQGWMIISGCRAPQFKMDADTLNSVDVTVLALVPA